MNYRKRNISFWVIVLIVVTFFFLKNSGVITSCYLSTFLTWPLILFCVAVFSFIYRNWVLGVVSLAAAIFFWTPILLKTNPDICPCISEQGFQGFVHHYWYLLVGFIAVVLIIKHLFEKESHCNCNCHEWKRHRTKIHESVDGFITGEVVFSSNEKIYFNENFKGGRFATVFGSQEIDLRKCTIQNNEKAYLDLSVVFGSYIIWIPAEWTVQLHAESVCSSIEDKRIHHPENADRDMLIINGKCVCSSLEIRS